MTIKGINFDEFKEEILKNPQVLKAYIAEKKNKELREQLLVIMKKTQLTSK